MKSRYLLLAAVFANPLHSPQNKNVRFADALRSIMEMNVAQVQHFSRFGRYAASLAELAPAADLARDEKRGYRFGLSLTPAGYRITAIPTGPGHGDRRVLSSDQSLVIRQDGTPLSAAR